MRSRFKAASLQQLHLCPDRCAGRAGVRDDQLARADVALAAGYGVGRRHGLDFEAGEDRAQLGRVVHAQQEPSPQARPGGKVMAAQRSRLGAEAVLVFDGIDDDARIIFDSLHPTADVLRPPICNRVDVVLVSAEGQG